MSASCNTFQSLLLRTPVTGLVMATAYIEKFFRGSETVMLGVFPLRFYSLLTRSELKMGCLVLCFGIDYRIQIRSLDPCKCPRWCLSYVNSMPGINPPFDRPHLCMLMYEQEESLVPHSHDPS